MQRDSIGDHLLLWQVSSSLEDNLLSFRENCLNSMRLDSAGAQWDGRYNTLSSYFRPNPHPSFTPFLNLYLSEQHVNDRPTSMKHTQARSLSCLSSPTNQPKITIINIDQWSPFLNSHLFEQGASDPIMITNNDQRSPPWVWVEACWVWPTGSSTSSYSFPGHQYQGQEIGR